MERLARFAPDGWPPSSDWVGAVVTAYSSPGRHYHTVEHVAEVAERYAEVATSGPGWAQPLDVFLAVLAHDAVYDVARADNEARSAELAREWSVAWLGADGARAADLVLATAGHGGPPPQDDPELLLFLDCDLAVLGADEARYDAYADGVRREFTRVVPDELYRAGRGRFLAGMLAKRTLFHTAHFRERLEERARANLTRELASLVGNVAMVPAGRDR